LKQFPLYNTYQNSPQGQAPSAKSDVAWNLLDFSEKIAENPWELLNYGQVQANYLMALWGDIMLLNGLLPKFAELMTGIMAIVNYIIMTILTWLLECELLWALIRLILLMLIYAILAIEILTMAAIFLAVGETFNALGSLTGFNADYQVKWWAEMGKDTRIGYLSIDVFDYDVCVEGWVFWEYWNYFQLYIPSTDMDFGMDIAYGEPSTEPEAPTLHCGYIQIGPVNSTLFEFFTTYRDANADEPEYVKLHLIAPNGTETAYNMTSTSVFYDEDLCQFGVRYNITIDFNDMNTEQYFYYFTAKENTQQGYTVKFPYDHYCDPGPYLDITRSPDNPFPYLLYSYEEPYFGTAYDIFNFTVVGADFIENKLPNNVSFNALWNNGTIESFSMSAIDSYTFDVGSNSTARNITLTTYQASINFSQYIDITEKFLVRAYYQAEFADGDISILFDYSDEDGKKLWCEGPIILSEGGVGQGSVPEILGWKVEELRDDKTFYDGFIEDDFQKLNSPIGPITDNHILRFWVFVKDPDGDHRYHLEEEEFEFEPELVLTNLNDPENPLESIDMVWAGKGFGPYSDVDAYFVDVLPTGEYTYDHEEFESFDFTPGAWTFNFTVEDNEANKDNLGAESRIAMKKIWYTGSAKDTWNTMMNGYDASGNALDDLVPGAGIVSSVGVAVAYAAAGLLTRIGPKGRIASRLVSMGIAAVDLVNTMLGFTQLSNTTNTGALLGLAIGSIISSAGIAIANKIGTIKSKQLNLKLFSYDRLKGLGGVATIAFILQLIYALYNNPQLLASGDSAAISENWNDPLNINQYVNLPMEIIRLFLSTFALGIVLNMADTKKEAYNIGGKIVRQVSPVITITKYHVYFKTAISLLCVYSFMHKTGMFHLTNDYFHIEDITYSEYPNF
jgi:hypothetical protein